MRITVKNTLGLLARFRFPIEVFIVTRIIFLVLAALSYGAPMQDNADTSVWTRWDGGWYYTIAADGYWYLAEGQSNIAFFPVFPLLMRAAGVVTGDIIAAGVLITHAALLGSLITAYALMRYEVPDDPDAAERLVLYLAFAPTAFFFSTVYTESLFLLLSLIAVYAARRGWWTLGIAAAIVLSATRVVGVLIVLFMALEWARSHGFTLRTMFTRRGWRGLINGILQQPAVLLAIGLIPFGLFSHMLYLNTAYGDPWLFREVQSAWGRSTDQLFVATTEIARTLFDLAAAGEIIPLSMMLNVGALILTIILSFAVWVRFGTSYGVYMLATIAVSASASLTSYFRYAFVMFPMLMVLALVGKRSKVLHYAILVLFASVYGMLALLFVRDVYFE